MIHLPETCKDCQEKKVYVIYENGLSEYACPNKRCENRPIFLEEVIKELSLSM